MNKIGIKEGVLFLYISGCVIDKVYSNKLRFCRRVTVPNISVFGKSLLVVQFSKQKIMSKFEIVVEVCVILK